LAVRVRARVQGEEEKALPLLGAEKNPRGQEGVGTRKGEKSFWGKTGGKDEHEKICRGGDSGNWERKLQKLWGKLCPKPTKKW